MRYCHLVIESDFPEAFLWRPPAKHGTRSEHTRATRQGILPQTSNSEARLEAHTSLMRRTPGASVADNLAAAHWKRSVARRTKVLQVIPRAAAAWTSYGGIQATRLVHQHGSSRIGHEHCNMTP
ncbi:hypothetical protein NM688_g8486 [Phlebia brevispora]|uniref:Uncharacterized protein n=1 Tax=Phlebia brevispora TaxID=194682 RepID=A0ACC1RSS6_9APHY|nr:hypothetical protein NM688_g8486 [Phlebia brevispora]